MPPRPPESSASLPCLSVCLEVQRQRCLKRSGQRARSIQSASDRPIEEAADVAGWRQLGRRRPDVDSRESGALERAGQRSRGEMVDVHEIIGERDAMAAQPGEPALLGQLRGAVRHFDGDDPARLEKGGQRRQQPCRLGDVLEHVGQNDGCIAMPGQRERMCVDAMDRRARARRGVRRRPRIQLDAFDLPALTLGEVKEPAGVRANIEETAIAGRDPDRRALSESPERSGPCKSRGILLRPIPRTSAGRTCDRKSWAASAALPAARIRTHGSERARHAGRCTRAAPDPVRRIWRSPCERSDSASNEEPSHTQHRSTGRNSSSATLHRDATAGSS